MRSMTHGRVAILAAEAVESNRGIRRLRTVSSSRLTAIWPIVEAQKAHEIRLIDLSDERLGKLPHGDWDTPPHTVAVVPVPASGPTGRAGAVIVGLNPYRALDDNYINFLKLIANQVSTSIANAEAYEHERQRAEALAESGSGKDHLLQQREPRISYPAHADAGAAGNMLADPSANAGVLREIDIVHRNGLRLLKLVNTLLDFSRIEAGRVQAVYQPINLCATTIELASVFRAAMEAAGLQFLVECAPLSRPVYVDSEMWEKIRPQSPLQCISNSLWQARWRSVCARRETSPGCRFVIPASAYLKPSCRACSSGFIASRVPMDEPTKGPGSAWRWWTN